MKDDEFSQDELKELDRLYADWCNDQQSHHRRPRSYSDELVRSVVAHLRRNRMATLTLSLVQMAAGAGGSYAVLTLSGQAPEAVLQALAALSALVGIGGALRLIKNARKPRANRRGDQVGGVNVDPTVDWEEYVHD